MLLKLLVVFIELSKLVRKDVSVWNKVIMLLAKSFLHSDDIEAKPILPCDFMTLREMVYFLIFIKALVQVTFATRR